MMKAKAKRMLRWLISPLVPQRIKMIIYLKYNVQLFTDAVNNPDKAIKEGRMMKGVSKEQQIKLWKQEIRYYTHRYNKAKFWFMRKL